MRAGKRPLIAAAGQGVGCVFRRILALDATTHFGDIDGGSGASETFRRV